MRKFKNLAIIILLLFMLIYTTYGNSINRIWSAFYFITVHSVLLLSFLTHKNKVIRIGNTALQISILIYVICKFFLSFSYERYYSLIPFTVIVVTVLFLEKNHFKDDGNIN